MSLTEGQGQKGQKRKIATFPRKKNKARDITFGLMVKVILKLPLSKHSSHVSLMGFALLVVKFAV